MTPQDVLMQNRDQLRLHRFEARQSSDIVKTDLELTCTGCGEPICDVEPGDSLEVLVTTVLEHVCGQPEPSEARP